VQASPQPAPGVYHADNRTIHLWAVGGMADYMLFVSFNALILPIFTTGFGLSPVLVGWALMLPRVFDAFVDPIIGHLSDNLHTRWGRRRPFMLGASVLGAVLVMAMWWPSRDWSSGLQFAWLLACSILLFICYGAFSMTHVALGYELSDDYHLRTRVVAVRSFYFALAALCGGWLYWLALRPYFGNEITGIRWVSVGMAAVILMAGLIPVVGCRERFTNVHPRHVHLWTAVRTTLKNRPFVIILLLRIAQTLGASLYGALSFYIGAYCVCAGDKSLFTSLAGINGLVGFAASLALVPLSARLSRRLGKRLGLLYGFTAAFLGAVLLPFFARSGHPYLLLTHLVAFGCANLVLTMFMSAVMPDICDLDELESGERREGLFSAVMSFVSKIENSLCMLLGGYMVAFSGFNTHLAQQMVQQPPEVLIRLRWLGFTPAIVFTGLALAIAFFFPLTRTVMDDVRLQLEARRAVRNPETSA
jgi:GPH family glycoside/pentoside/hexuronide:cation symporter